MKLGIMLLHRKGGNASSGGWRSTPPSAGMHDLRSPSVSVSGTAGTACFLACGAHLGLQHSLYKQYALATSIYMQLNLMMM